MKVFTLNAFAKTANGGNPAGVLLNSDGLSDKQTLEIVNNSSVQKCPKFI